MLDFVQFWLLNAKFSLTSLRADCERHSPTTRSITASRYAHSFLVSVHHNFKIFAAGWVIVVGDFKPLLKFSRDVAMATKLHKIDHDSDKYR